MVGKLLLPLMQLLGRLGSAGPDRPARGLRTALLQPTTELLCTALFHADHLPEYALPAADYQTQAPPPGLTLPPSAPAL